MTKRVIIMNFEEESKAYQGFSFVKNLHAKKELKGLQMAVVTHSNDGNHQFKIDDFLDFTGNNHTSTDSLIGIIIGILGGPLGILLGWFAGGAIGVSQDLKEVKEAQSIFEYVINQIKEGDTGLLLIADEKDNRPLNHLIMEQLQGGIIRLNLEDVEADLQHAKKMEKNVSSKTMNTDN